MSKIPSAPPHHRPAAARVLVAVLALLVAAVSWSGWAQDTGPRRGAAILLTVDGAIGPATTDYIVGGLETAAARGAEIVVIRMDTPGGLSSSTRDIVRAILASPVPVATFVAPSGARAASAGTYILYASGLAAMAPGTNLGAATPIPLGGGGSPLGAPQEEDDDDEDGGDAPGDAAGAKAVNDAAALLKSLAELHGRDEGFAERAVREAESLSAADALDQGVVEIIAEDVEEMLAKADGRAVRTGEGTVTLATEGIPVVQVEADWRNKLLAAISNPNIAYLFMLIGIYGIIFELASPGAIVPGTVGAISLVVGLFSLNLLGVDYAGAGLLLLGVALMAAEAFVPSFGILGIGGAVAFALGSVFLFEDVPGISLSPSVIVVATVLTGLLLVIVLAAVVRAHRRRTVTGNEALVGTVGEVLTWSKDRGEVRVHGELWHARSVSPLKPGDRVEVTGRDELVLIVRPAVKAQV